MPLQGGVLLGCAGVFFAEQPVPRSRWLAAPLDRANFTGLVLGCIEAKFCE